MCYVLLYIIMISQMLCKFSILGTFLCIYCVCVKLLPFYYIFISKSQKKIKIIFYIVCLSNNKHKKFVKIKNRRCVHDIARYI